MTPSPTDPAQCTMRPGIDQADGPALRYAMLSVYYASLGRYLCSQGAPAMLMPMGARPLSLRDALEQIQARWPQYLRDAVWRVARSTPAPPKGETGGGSSRYPRALKDLIDADRPLSELDTRRGEYRAGANVLAAALVALVNEDLTEYDALRELLAAPRTDFDTSALDALGLPLSEFLDQLVGHDRTADRVRRLQSEVGLDPYSFIGRFADAAAFVRWWADTGDRQTAFASGAAYPATCTISQDSRTLITTVTATALVCGGFEQLKAAVDPQDWARSSDVIALARYVSGPRALTPTAPSTPFDPPMYLEERASVSWGFDVEQAREQTGEFHNVLRIDRFDADEETGDVDVEFALARSIDSRILWDARPGGLRIDQGSLRVRNICDDRWRVTSHKALQFSDRTPNAGGSGGLDFGQMLNYLAPAALSWWVESELYSIASPDYKPEGAADGT